VPSMRARGFDAASISDRIEAIAHDDWRANNPRAGLARVVRTLTQRADHDAPDLARAIDQERPDALLVDITAWGALAAAEAWAGPWATFCPPPLPVRSADAPPFGPGLPPARGPLGRLRDRLLRPVVFAYPRPAGAGAGRRRRRPARPRAAAAVPDRRAVRIPAPRLARQRRAGRPLRLGPTIGPAALAGRP
jgi:hypothetical protein